MGLFVNLLHKQFLLASRVEHPIHHLSMLSQVSKGFLNLPDAFQSSQFFDEIFTNVCKICLG